MFLSNYNFAIGIRKSEVGSGKSVEKAEDIQLNWLNFIFSHVKNNFFKHALYIMSISSYIYILSIPLCVGRVVLGPFLYAFLYYLSNFAIVSLRKRKLNALL